MADTPLSTLLPAAPPIQGDMTEEEVNYFRTGGDVSDKLLEEHQAPAETQLPAETQQQQVQTPGQTIEETDDEPAVPGTKPRRIQYAKYEAEQQRALKLEQDLQAERVRNARVDERLNILAQAMAGAQPAAQQQQPAEFPDPEQDIFAAVRWLREQLDARVNPIRQEIDDYRKSLETGQAEMEEQSRYVSDINSYAGREPNFMGAYQYLLHSRAAELLAPRYPNATHEQLMNAIVPDDVMAEIVEEEKSLYKNAFEARQSPAANIWSMAIARGFRPPAAAAPAANGAAPANGAAAPAKPGTPLNQAPAQRPAAAAPAAPSTAAALVEQIKRGQPAAASLSNVSGNNAPTKLTPQALADMPEEQFQAIVDELQSRGDLTTLKELFGA